MIRPFAQAVLGCLLLPALIGTFAVAVDPSLSVSQSMSFDFGSGSDFNRRRPGDGSNGDMTAASADGVEKKKKNDRKKKHKMVKKHHKEKKNHNKKKNQHKNDKKDKKDKGGEKDNKSKAGKNNFSYPVSKAPSSQPRANKKHAHKKKQGPGHAQMRNSKPTTTTGMPTPAPTIYKTQTRMKSPATDPPAESERATNDNETIAHATKPDQKVRYYIFWFYVT